jgi:hypothetical protein
MACRFWLFSLMVALTCETAFCQCRVNPDHAAIDHQGQCKSSGVHAAAEKDGVLRGNIVDRMDAPIPAFLFVHSNVGQDRIATQIPVNSEGSFEINLPPGLYDLFVGYTSFVPIALIVEIKSGKKTHLNLTMKLDEKHLESVLVE